MKKIFQFALFIFMLVPNTLIPAYQQINPKIALSEISFNFKEIYEGDNLEHTFIVFNKGVTVLIIEKIETG
ncbi:MAG: DUF1573 domain-containing protein [Desulfobacteraceae bacterium]|nr:MAG: DUF1573 domain-containing protein [Desulfobacteraceae bacterium]